MTKKILFICYGNICRSPMAQGVFENKAAATKIDCVVDSAGTSNWHEGEKPDARAIAICREKNIDISKQTSRAVSKDDFTEFDLILAMDKSNLKTLNQIKPKSATAEIKLFLDYAQNLDTKEVPDPYYDDNGFAIVFSMIENAAMGLIKKL